MRGDDDDDDDDDDDGVIDKREEIWQPPLVNVAAEVS